MFSQTQSSTSTKASDDDEEEDDDLGEEEPATTSIYRRTVSHRVAQSYDSDEDEEDDDDISSDSTERPVKPSPISLTGRSDFCPVDPISHPNQYRERGDATSSNHVLANPSSSAQQENTHQQTPHKGHWAKNPRASVCTVCKIQRKSLMICFRSRLLKPLSKRITMSRVPTLKIERNSGIPRAMMIAIQRIGLDMHRIAT
jgi:hypothetical protein